MECALLGESWKQKAFTLYPNSARVAEAEAPAKPVPITIISIFLLFEGLTNLILPLCVFHLSKRGPIGTLESSVGLVRTDFLSFEMVLDISSSIFNLSGVNISFSES